MSKQRTLPGMTESTCLAESVAGNLPCTLPDGLPIGQPGQAVVPVSRTQQRASKKAKRTKGTCGPKCSGSSASADLQSCLESRLIARLNSVGSMEYSQTWREKATPAGRSYWAHTASARRTSDSESTGWPTVGVNPDGSLRNQMDQLPRQAALCGWGTPRVSDGTLAETTAMPPSGEMGRLELQVLGAVTTSSPAETEKRGALNPAHSRWLQGYPISWCEAAILAHRLMPRQRQRHAKCG